MDRSIRRKLGRNLEVPHVHHVRDVVGLVSSASAPQALVPFDTVVATQDLSISIVAPLVYTQIGSLTSGALVLPPLPTAAQKYRVWLRLCATIGAFQSSSPSCVGSIQFFQNNLAFPPIKKFFGNTNPSADFLFPFNMEQVVEVVPGTYTWDARWQIESGAGNTFFLRGGSGRFEVEVDTLVQS